MRAVRRLATMLLLATAVRADAQEIDPERMEAFAAHLYERMDLDGDGRLTRAEYDATGGGGFPVDYDLLDLDGNGAVSKSEYLLAVRRYHLPRSSQPI